ncbi:chaperonin [Bdellovibrio bacteriovorus str. Tiberius]|uniref:Co-chaperonin GroES n=1 Tax=Bdellovibrio bacteriovorus str. Tiberius TaxID=1069642 RepID=K7YSV9_BDEBC|nr:chaperonin [Bdellovibrio bacteriovorus str. Tiberius]
MKGLFVAKKKSSAKKASVKKVVKKAVKKSGVKKSPAKAAKKPAPAKKKAPAKKTAAKAPAKKAAVKKPAVKKAVAKKPVAKKAVKAGKPAAKKAAAKPAKAAAPKVAMPTAHLVRESAPVKKLDLSGFVTPLDDRLMVQVSGAEKMTAGGLYIPDSVADTSGNMQGFVVAVGRGHMNKKGHVRPMDVQVGDKVVFSEYAGSKIKIQNEDLIILREADVMGVVSK